MLKPVPIPGLLVTATDTGMGKTVIAAAIGQWFNRMQGARVAVLKPVATGCVHRREGLVSEDAEFLAHCADAHFPLDLICPQRYAEPLAPAIAAMRAKEPLDWEAVQRSIRIMADSSDVMIVEGIGGLMVPMDDRHTFLDVAEWLKLPVLVVARAGLGTINHTLLTLHALKSRKVKIAGVIINRYPTDTPPAAEETNPKAIEKWGKVPVVAIVPDDRIPTTITNEPIPAGIAAAIRAVDWARLAGMQEEE